MKLNPSKSVRKQSTSQQRMNSSHPKDGLRTLFEGINWMRSMILSEWFNLFVCINQNC